MESLDNRFEIAARVYRSYQRRMIGEKVRINESFSSDRDMNDVYNGTAVYPDRLGLDLNPPKVGIGSSILTLSEDLIVQEVYN